MHSEQHLRAIDRASHIIYSIFRCSTRVSLIEETPTILMIRATKRRRRSLLTRKNHHPQRSMTTSTTWTARCVQSDWLKDLLRSILVQYLRRCQAASEEKSLIVVRYASAYTELEIKLYGHRIPHANIFSTALA
jgi:hypothetical protein